MLGHQDDRWIPQAPALALGTATFGILALELALIRWVAGQIRIFAYFNNLILIAAFLGMGLGVAIGRRRPGLVHGVLPALAVVSGVVGFSEDLGIVRMAFPDTSVHLWGAEARGSALHLVAFLGVLGAIVGLFVLAGAPVGALFGRLPVLGAYGADLAGSLLGIAAISVATWMESGPWVWLLVSGLPFLLLSRRLSGALGLAAAVAMGHHSQHGAVFSPYNRIDVGPEDPGTRSVMIEVNRDFHQFMHDLSDANVRRGDLPRSSLSLLRLYRTAYDLPFSLAGPSRRALVVGAGTGNDVAAALRSGVERVVACDIDGTLVSLGRQRHPERPYDDARVEVVVNDARAFFEQYRGEPFDVVAYGLLDSHAMFASLSTLRLDNYVYTEEGIRAAFRHVAPHGLLALSFSVFAGDWIADRLHYTIADATGIEPLVIPHGMHHGATFVVSRSPGRIDPSAFAELGRRAPAAPRDAVSTTRDDWPFLYVRPGVFPIGYVLVLGAVMALAAVAVPLAYGRGDLRRDFDVTLFLMGAGFLLVETRGVTALSLLFGSTWIVNAAIFSAVLVMALGGNVVVAHFRPTRTGPWFALLLASVVLVYLVHLAPLNQLPLAARGAVGSLVHALPIGFAGIIVPILLARARSASAALGSNLLGAVLGGSLEYLSMAVGLRALALLALAIYLAALLAELRRDAA